MGSLENNERSLNSVFCSEVLFHSFITNPSLSYFECAEKFLQSRGVKLSKNEVMVFCYRCLYSQQISLLREILCLAQNGVKRGRVDLSNENFVKEINRLKEKTIIKGDKDITNYNYIKALRNALAHNNELKDNPAVVFGSDKKDGKGIVVKSIDARVELELSMKDLHELCVAIFKGINKTDALGIYPRRLENAIIGGYFDVDNLNRYITGVKEGSSYELELDSFQKTAFVNYTKTGEIQKDKLVMSFFYRCKNSGIRMVYPDLIKQIFPNNSKPEDLALHKCFLFFTNDKIAQNLNRTKDDVLDLSKDMQEFYNVFMAFCLNSNYATFLSVTNGLYSMLSDRELEDVEKELLEKLGDDARHVRNAMQHGTYYYNFDNGIEVYDGGKKLKHITTLNLSETAYAMHETVIKRSKTEIETDRNI